MGYRTVLVVIGFFTLACAAVKVPMPTGGSKADATVTLSYEYGVMEDVEVDWNQSDYQALQRCRNWGYSQAESFGNGTEVCIQVNSYGTCLRYRVDITYQCMK